MPTPVDTIRFLAETIGPRPSASPATRRAASWLAEQFRSAGLELSLQSFQGLQTYSLNYGLLYAAFAAAGWLVKPAPRLAAILAVLAAWAFRGEQTYRPRLSRLLPKGEGTNVVAYRPASGEQRQTVVLVGHLDTHHAALLFHPALVPGFRRSFFLGLAAMGVILGVSIGEAVRCTLGRNAPAAVLPVWLARAAGGFVASNLAFILHRHLFLGHTPGANDNGSGTAAVLAAATTLPPLDHTALWIVITDCEETGSDGMLAFLATHETDLDPATTFFLNVDNVGAGRVTVASEEGSLKAYRPDSTLLAVARDVIASEDLDVEVHPYRLLGTDGEAAMEHGYRALSILALDERGLLPNWHWPSDTVENIEPSTVETATRLVEAMVRALERRLARP